MFGTFMLLLKIKFVSFVFNKIIQSRRILLNVEAHGWGKVFFFNPIYIHLFVVEEYDGKINKKIFKHKNTLHWDKNLWGKWIGNAISHC